MTSCSANEDRAQHLTQKLSRYFLLYQECSDQVRPYGRANMDPIYDEVYKEWRSDPSNPLVEPALGDQGKCDAYFANCDSICALQPQNAHEYVPGWFYQSACHCIANKHTRAVFTRSVLRVGLEYRLSKAYSSLRCPTESTLSQLLASSRKRTIPCPQFRSLVYVACAGWMSV